MKLASSYLQFLQGEAKVWQHQELECDLSFKASCTYRRRLAKEFEERYQNRAQPSHGPSGSESFGSLHA
ncbi:hypothetical protein DPMN_026987 [Dreissena polymorpha]|uniref:Uncharacterized protein n=1 Tax=Dreissena polymorpha TaxID=45954 RepID=A0A9D4LUE3_DREPO|nr:hypothetical protein DPMN_026987 [Dreissena polymorpha]